MNEQYMVTDEPARRSLAERLGKSLTQDLESEAFINDTIKEELQDHTNHLSYIHQRRADAINAMLRAKGIEAEFSADEAGKLWYIAETLESVTS